MTTFTAWKFETVDGAEKATALLRSAAKDGVITIEDYAVIEWEIGAERPRVKYEHRDDARAAGWVPCWVASSACCSSCRSSVRPRVRPSAC